jgi:hypothetical protein
MKDFTDNVSACLSGGTCKLTAKPA